MLSNRAYWKETNANKVTNEKQEEEKKEDINFASVILCSLLSALCSLYRKQEQTRDTTVE